MASGSALSSVGENKDDIQKCSGNPPSRSRDISWSRGEEDSSQRKLLQGRTNMEDDDLGTNAMRESREEHCRISQPTDVTDPGNLI